MKTRHPYWRRAGRIAFIAFLVVVTVLLVRYARSIDWNAVADAIAGYDAATLAMAVALALSSYLIYGGYDLCARAYAHHALSARRVMLIAAICYAFSLNIGAAVGSAGFRYRLYSRSGLAVGTINRIVAFSVSSNWLGYLLLAGALFGTRSVALPADWKIGVAGLQALGVAMLATVLAYLIACWWSHDRVFHVRGHHFRLPSPRLALLQLALAAANWSAMAAILYLLLQYRVDYAMVLGVLLLGAVATAIAHIPAGIGVLEAVFIALLGQTVAQPQLVAALLVYRAFYYLAPLIAASALYAAFEAKSRRSPHAARGM
ncbi:lysylphosphatidylglycerol synthase domain-containing protein [Luteimonas sp. SX5]|uniref:Lysylphosphatidylglycerol synthase domain-containing protein n=1 Tax=Luteimonas galliterrae TaxID=2940486 RepID=A0ABT0MGZ1_9GAMM|nr:YbhN family protein [Luteimonas galliterrae]MCL1634146.1 lysylphosphatidylglycerol synthase domain-containing protein [Luteimonas galliterrae]